MASGIVRGYRTVPALAGNDPVLHQDSAHRHLACRFGMQRQRKRLVHIVLIAHVSVSRELVAEMPDARKHHGKVQPIRRRDDLLVTDRSARLDYGGDPMSRGFFDAIRKREEGIGGEHGVFLGQYRFHRTHLHAIDTAHLTGSGADRLSGARIDDRV